MELGVFTKVYQGAALPQALSAAAANGLSCVHLNLETLGLPKRRPPVTKAAAESVRKEMQASGVRAVTLSATYNLIHPDKQARQEAIETVADLARLAAWAGVPYLAVCTGTNDPDNLWAPHPENRSEASYRVLCRSLEALLPLCQAQGLRLLVEPESANVIADARQARRLLDDMRSPGLGIIMDGANLLASAPEEETLYRAFDLLGENICVAHAKDVRPGPVFVPAGQGCMPYGLYLRLLERLPASCPLLLHGLKEAELSKCIAFLRGKRPAEE